MKQLKKMATASTPQEMRQELFEHIYENTLVERVFRKAQAEGLSGEDIYTMLAYYSVQLTIELENKDLRRLMERKTIDNVVINK